MRIGVLASSGGSALAAALDILRHRKSPQHEFVGVTDRECGFENVCRDAGIAVERIGSNDREVISSRAAEIFASADAVLLFFARITSPALFSRIPTFNIHPALLPAFAGTMKAVKHAGEIGVRFLGATLHLVSESVDGGPIIGQVVMPIDPIADGPRLEKYSYVQKVYLTLLLVELLERGDLLVRAGAVQMPSLPYNDRCNPALRDNALIEGVLALQMRENVSVVR